MAIRPVDLPSAAGVDYGGGDVRHFSPGDAADVPGLQNPTRQLAQRDNLVADKLNEVIGVVNNREQLVQLPMVRTVLAPSESLTVTNYRIPVGFESRVLNASISSTPQVPDIELDIFYSAGTFGNVTGTSIVATATEFTGGVNFYQTGEFIVALKNKSAVTLEISASILLTIRPIGAEGSLLVASVIQGQQGPPGQGGPPGPPGTPGSGGAGSPGMIWTGSFQSGRTYRDKEVASFPLYGTLLSSFIARTTTTEDPGTSYFANDGVWNPVAIGSSGPPGVSGTGGPPGVSGSVPYVATQTVFGTLYTGPDWVVTPVTGYSDVLIDAFGGTVGLVGNHTYRFPMRENYIESTTPNLGFQRGMTVLLGALRFAFSGDGTFAMPTAALSNSKVDYNSSNCDVILAVSGTVPTIIVNGTGSIPTTYTVVNGTDIGGVVTGTGTFPQTIIDGGGVGVTELITCYPTGLSSNQFVIKSVNPSPVWVQVAIHGGMTY